MRTKYQITEQDGIYFITSTIIEWIPVFTTKEYADIIMQSLTYCRGNKGLKLFAYVVMDNHVHLVVSADQLSRLIKEFKSYTARKIIETSKIDKRDWLLNQFEFYKKRYKNDSAYQVWQEGVHPQIVNSEDILRQKIEYIHNNPVKRGFVERPEHWVYSSARNYIHGEGCIDIDFAL